MIQSKCLGSKQTQQGILEAKNYTAGLLKLQKRFVILVGQLELKWVKYTVLQYKK